MGLFRFLLAFAVFNAHAGLPVGFSMLAGFTAVHCFFIISGFYMAMVLSEKYAQQQATYFDFISSRALRLMPSYLAVLALTCLLGLWIQHQGMVQIPPVQAAGRAMDVGLPLRWWIAHVMSQVSLLGQDLYAFVDWLPGLGLVMNARPPNESSLVHEMLLVPPAWSLSLEIYFYLLAPFIVRMPIRTILSLALGSMLIRLVLALFGEWRTDPWSYRFFPSELAYFLGGVLAYRWKSVPAIRGKSGKLLLYGLALGALEIFGIWSTDMPWQKWLRLPLFALVCAGVPWLFERTRHWRLDRYIGELSFPLYICHVLVIWMLESALGPSQSVGYRFALIGTTILCAIALHRLIDRPIDAYRQARLRRRSTGYATGKSLPEQA